MANFPDARWILGSSIMVQIFHALNIILTHDSGRTANSRPRIKGSFFASLETENSLVVASWLICVHFHGCKITYTHSQIISGNREYLPRSLSPFPCTDWRNLREIQGLQGAHLPWHSKAVRGGAVLPEHGYLKHSSLPEWALCAQKMRKEQTGQGPSRCKSIKACT